MNWLVKSKNDKKNRHFPVLQKFLSQYLQVTNSCVSMCLSYFLCSLKSWPHRSHVHGLGLRSTVLDSIKSWRIKPCVAFLFTSFVLCCLRLFLKNSFFWHFLKNSFFQKRFRFIHQVMFSSIVAIHHGCNYHIQHTYENKRLLGVCMRMLLYITVVIITYSIHTKIRDCWVYAWECC